MTLHELGDSIQAAQLFHALAKGMLDLRSLVTVPRLAFDGLSPPRP
jgi:hypothetical protein